VFYYWSTTVSKLLLHWMFSDFLDKPQCAKYFSWCQINSQNSLLAVHLQECIVCTSNLKENHSQFSGVEVYDFLHIFHHFLCIQTLDLRRMGKCSTTGLPLLSKLLLFTIRCFLTVQQPLVCKMKLFACSEFTQGYFLHK